jgi:GAF domain-containing protein
MQPDDLNTQDRLAHHYLGAPDHTERLEGIVTFAAVALGFPHAQINILDATTLHVIRDHEGGGPHMMSRADTVCTFTVDNGGVLAMNDMRLDPRSANLPGVLAGQAASYLGVPLRSREAANVGTLCFFDTEPRTITSEEIEQVAQFGRIVENALDLIRRTAELKQAAAQADAEGVA